MTPEQKKKNRQKTRHISFSLHFFKTPFNNSICFKHSFLSFCFRGFLHPDDTENSEYWELFGMKTKTVNIVCWLLAARVQKYWKRALKKTLKCAVVETTDFSVGVWDSKGILCLTSQEYWLTVCLKRHFVFITSLQLITWKCTKNLDYRFFKEAMKSETNGERMRRL